MPLPDINDATFEQVTAAATKPLLIEFTADWCASCRAAAPMVERAAGELSADFDVFGAQLDDSEQLASRLGVRSIPTMVLLVDGKVRATRTELKPNDDLAAWARSSLSATGKA